MSATDQVAKKGQGLGSVALSGLHLVRGEESPRTKFINSTLVHGAPPLPVVVRSALKLKKNIAAGAHAAATAAALGSSGFDHEHHTTSSGLLDLSGRGLGDARMLQMTHALVELPAMNALRLADNALSDKAVSAVLDALHERANLKLVDVSQNKIEWRSVAALSNMLLPRSCQLRTLQLEHCSIDDGAARTIFDALRLNHSITSCSLAHNNIGASSASHAGGSDIISIDEALQSVFGENTSLLDMNLSWNKITSSTAAVIGKALGPAYGALSSIDLSHNSTGDGTGELAWALRTNATITRVDLSHSRVSAKAMIVLASALKARRGRQLLVKLHGHAWPQQVKLALLSSLTSCGVGVSSCVYDLADCSFEVDDISVFNIASPGGSHRLNLRDRYERTVALELIELAGQRAACTFEAGSVRMLNAKDVAKADKVAAALRDERKAYKVAARKAAAAAAVGGGKKKGAAAVIAAAARMETDLKKHEAAFRKKRFGLPVALEKHTVDTGIGKGCRPEQRRAVEAFSAALGDLARATFRKEGRARKALPAYEVTSVASVFAKALRKSAKRLAELAGGFSFDTANLSAWLRMAEDPAIAEQLVLEYDDPRSAVGMMAAKAAPKLALGAQPLEPTMGEDAFVSEVVHALLHAPVGCTHAEVAAAARWDVPEEGWLDCCFVDRQWQRSWHERTPALVLASLATRLRAQPERHHFDAALGQLFGMDGADLVMGANFAGLCLSAVQAETLLCAACKVASPPNNDGSAIPANAARWEREEVRRAATQAILPSLPFGHTDRLLRGICSLAQVCTDATEALAFLLAYIPDTCDPAVIHARMQVLSRMGASSFRAVFGTPTGHYSLDLTKAQDRVTAVQLFRLSSAAMAKLASAGRWDPSQHQDRSCFRNATLKAAPLQLTPAFFEALPLNGTLEFDFVYVQRPEPQQCGSAAASKTRCPGADGLPAVAISEEEMDAVVAAMGSDSGGGGVAADPEAWQPREASVHGPEMDQSSLGKLAVLCPSRWFSVAQMIRVMRLFQPSHEPSYSTHELHAKRAWEKQRGADEALCAGEAAFALGHRVKAAPVQARRPSKAPADKDNDTVRLSRLRRSSIAAHAEAEEAILVAVEAPTAHGHFAVHKKQVVLVAEKEEEAAQHGRNLVAPRVVGPGSRAHTHSSADATLAALPDMPLHAYAGPLPLRPDRIVNPRVAVILTLWDRLVDREEMHHALDLLTRQEMQDAVYRLGWLNLFDPRVADGPYFFDLAHADHRAAVFLLIELQNKESGELWSEQVFQWAPKGLPVEGYQLRAMRGKWQMEAALMEKRGRLNFNYSSTRSGNASNPKAREKMAESMAACNCIEFPES